VGRGRICDRFWWQIEVVVAITIAKLDAAMDSTEQEKVQQALINISIESWRFAKLFGRVLTKLDAGDGPRYANQLRYFLKRIDETLDTSGLKLVNLEGQPYDPGLAASALNVADFGPDDRLVVDQMVEPIVMNELGLVRPGTVMLRKVEK